MLQPEVERHAPWWSYLGAACGGGIGFIVANIPGLVLGAAAGNRLGAIRDAKGKSVAAVFQELGATQKAEVRRLLTFFFFFFGLNSMCPLAFVCLCRSFVRLRSRFWALRCEA